MTSLRRGSRSLQARLIRKGTHALRQHHLHSLLEFVFSEDLFILRPTKPDSITYGYPYCKPLHGDLQSLNLLSGATVTPLEHLAWSSSITHIAEASSTLPTMLRGSLALHSSLPPASIRFIRQHNHQALSILWGHQGRASQRLLPDGNHWNLECIDWLIKVTRFRDYQLLSHLTHGFPVVGYITDGGLFNMSDHPKIPSKTVSDLTTSPNDLEHIINYLRRTRPSDPNLIHAVEEDVRQEALLGRALGPLSPDIALQAPSFCSPIFAIHQSNKIRLISNYAFRSHGVRLNDTAEVHHKVSMPRLSHIALVAQALGSGTKHLSRTDLEDAYRQLKICPDHRPYTIGIYLNSMGLPQATIPGSCPFGATSSVTSFLRTGEFYCHVLRSLGLVNALSYLDDFFPIEVPQLSASALTLIEFVMEILTGARIKHKKDIPPSHDNILLGLRVNLEHGQCIVSLTQDRRAKLICDLLDVKSGALVTSKLAGRVSFACDAFFGRVGRGPTRVLIRKSLGIPTPPNLLASAVDSLLHLFRMDNLPPRNLIDETALHHRPLCCYADATGDGRIGIFTPANNIHPAYFGFSKIKFREHADPIHINLLELVASASALHTFSKYHSGAVIIFTDNTTVQYLIHKGSSASTTVNEAISDFWLHTAAVGPFRLFALRVPSYSDPADAVSRQQFSTPWLRDAIRLPIAFPPWVSKYGIPKEVTSLA